MNQTSTASNMENEEKIRLWLATKYGVRGVFITLGCVAEILGMAPPTLMAHVRKGNFILPYKKIGASILIKVDDFVTWYCHSEDISKRSPKKPVLRESLDTYETYAWKAKEDYRNLMSEVMRKIAPAMKQKKKL